jgi:hypothetical protein
MLFAQMVINTWSRYAQKKNKLKDEESIEDIEPLYLKTTNFRAREERARSKMMPTVGLKPVQTHTGVPTTHCYEQLDREMLP